jgi:hypothetical protein
MMLGMIPEMIREMIREKGIMVEEEAVGLVLRYRKK